MALIFLGYFLFKGLLPTQSTKSFNIILQDPEPGDGDDDDDKKKKDKDGKKEGKKDKDEKKENGEQK